MLVKRALVYEAADDFPPASDENPNNIRPDAARTGMKLFRKER